MKEQLSRLMDDKKLSPAKFADEIGVQRSNISHILNDRNKPSYDFILRLLNHFKDVNPEWLLTGQGSMYKTSQTTVNISSQGDLFQTTNAAVTSKKEEKEKVIEKKHSVKNNLVQDHSKSNEIYKNGMFTNVNNIIKVIILYSNGTFDEYAPNH